VAKDIGQPSSHGVVLSLNEDGCLTDSQPTQLQGFLGSRRDRRGSPRGVDPELLATINATIVRDRIADLRFCLSVDASLQQDGPVTDRDALANISERHGYDS